VVYLHTYTKCICGVGVHAATFILAHTASTAGVNKCGAEAARLSSEADCGGRVSDVLKLEASINDGADRTARAAACGAQTWCWHLGVWKIVETLYIIILACLKIFFQLKFQNV
jgi:hypothetical protein